ncbi:MAG: rhodanese-like domain-containing protein [Gammaproteobacteria bacterium]|nr:rhodanese-like domain-containing protein [Gammaproteobacteria bacterium]MDH5776931.1 rhodanese-like domain-containing protein [Gammaproteobacteria bacterium]
MRRVQFLSIISILTLQLLSTSAFSKTDSEFPGRKLYLAVPVIELEELHKQKSQVVVVDVRSKYEYKTLRIKGAINIPLASPDFISRMSALRKEHASKSIVVYCNGKTCMKSYKAASKCRKKNINNVIAYDAGVMDWARQYPDESVLLGKSPINPNRLISKANFKKHLITPEKFEEKGARKDSLILDVRDQFQREGISIFGAQERRAPLDDNKMMNQFIHQAKTKGKTLLIYDQAGKQARWLMYRLEDKGLKNYYFMKGGISAYYDNLRKQYIR